MDKVRTTCSLCEACCGAVMDVEDGRIVKVRPDLEDPLSLGYMCSKGASIPVLEADPDRIRTPLLRINGKLREVGWDEAYRFIEDRVSALRQTYGPGCLAGYLGNGAGHNINITTYLAPFMGALGSANIYTSGTLDQIPRQAVSAILYGSASSVTIPDLDRCRLLWIIGANPAESNGSLLMAPGILRRLDKIRAAGGRVVVFDPRRTITARRASEHVMIRPSGDAAFLAAVAHLLLEEGPVDSRALALCAGVDALGEMLAPFAPERVATACGVEAETIRRLARELRDTPGAALYGRMGTTTQQFSSLVCWLIDLVNILAGNLDEIGGAMFTRPALAQENTLGIAGTGEGFQKGRWHTRVRGVPEVLGEFPAHCLPEEIETPGAGQIRGLFVAGANPILSNPDAARIASALDSLDLLVCLDIYVNETGRRADVILPSPPRLTRSNYDRWFYSFAVRTYSRYTAAYRPLQGTERSDREVLLRLTAILQGKGRDADIDQLEDELLLARIRSEIERPGSLIADRKPSDILADLQRLPPVERWLDIGFRLGPYGDQFGAKPGITFETVRDAPQGLDLGPLTPRLPDVLRTPSGTIELVHPFVAPELRRLGEWLGTPKPSFVLIGRRQARGNNSWFHNLAHLDHKTRRCTLTINESDAARLGIEAGDAVHVSSAIGSVTVEADVTADIVAGVVSLPHGWGHAAMEEHLGVASRNPGANMNVLVDGGWLDPLTGTAQLNGIPVTIEPVADAARPN